VSATWAGIIDTASLIVTALGIVVGGVVLVRTERLLPALAALLEMLTGAGLLRLAAAPTLTRALTAGSVLLVRRLATAGLRGALPLGGLPPRLRALTGRALKAGAASGASPR
jgi:hypothetical protein